MAWADVKQQGHQAYAKAYAWYERVWVISNREPLLTIRRIVWIVTGGWALALGYVLAALGMLSSIIFAPFALVALRFALFTFDIVTQENYIDPRPPAEKRFWQRPMHPFCCVANIVWLIVFGWALFLAHLATALVQALTIIGIPTALTSLQLAVFALWPFGQEIRRRYLPTSVEELHEHERQQAAERQPLASQEVPSGDEAV